MICYVVTCSEQTVLNCFYGIYLLSRMWKEFLIARVTLATSATNIMKSSYIQFCDISGVQE